MYDITEEARFRTTADWYGIAGTVLALLAFGSVAFYGMISGFTPSLAYQEANVWMGLACAIVAGLCGLYLAFELAPPSNVRFRALFPILCVFAGYYATVTGIPTIAAQMGGQRGSAIFSVTDASMPWGSKSCNLAIKASNPGYAELRFCADELSPRPRTGDQLRIDGNTSDWGIATDSVTVLR